MAIRNDNIELEYKSLFIPVTSFTGMGVIPDTSLSGDAQTLELDITSSGAQGAGLSEIGSTGLVGLEVETNSSIVSHFMAFPTFMDTDEDIYVRGHWTSASSDTADSFSVTVSYREYSDGDTIGTGPTAQLGVAIPTDFVSGNLDYQVTKAGTLNAGRLNPDDTDGIEWQVLLQFDSGLAEAKHFIGLEFFYLPKLTPGTQKSKVALPSRLVIAS